MKINPKKNYILNYIGGKFLIANWIIRHFKFHKRYVEIFGGGAHVILQKERLNFKDYKEIYNDLDGDLVNLYKMILEGPAEFFERCQYLPYSHKLYEDWSKDWKKGYKGKDNFERAMRYYFLQKTSFGGIFLNSYGGGSKKILAFRETLKRIPYFVKRFQSVLIENLDFEECIKKYDEPDTLFYCDPPYILEGGREYYNIKGFDHERLSKVLNSIKGYAVLSYYPDEKLKEFYGNWYANFKKVVKPLTLTKAKNGETRPEAIEMLLMNYKIKGLDQLKNINLCKYKI